MTDKGRFLDIESWHRRGSFRICHFPFASGFESFQDGAQQAIDRASPEELDARPEDDGTIHGSSLPWIRFTGLTHARPLGLTDSVPKITFGKATADGDEVLMPVSVEVHHALVDGLHVSQFLEILEGSMGQPETVFRAMP